MEKTQLTAIISKAPEYGIEGRGQVNIEVNEVILPKDVYNNQPILVGGKLLDEAGLTDELLGERELNAFCKAQGMIPLQLGDRLILYGKADRLARTPSEASLMEKTDENGTVLARYHLY
jgi:hypothetical protein